MAAVRGELSDMQEYLGSATRLNNAMRRLVIDLIGIVRGMRSTYGDLFDAYEQTLDKANVAYHEGHVDMLRHLIELDETTLQALTAVVEAFNSNDTAQRQHVLARLQALLEGQGHSSDLAVSES